MITTYLTDEEIKKYSLTTDADINHILKEVNELSFFKFCVQEHVTTIKLPRPWFIRSRRTIFYGLYTLYCIIRKPEVQAINFYVEMSDTSINMSVEKELILAYLYGIVAGHNTMMSLQHSFKKKQ